jgi:hypothetical protein
MTAKLHALKTEYRLWCGRTLYSGRYDLSTPGRPTTCKRCLAAIRREREPVASYCPAKATGG